MQVSVLTAVQSAARDRLEIEAGTPSFELMRRAGQRAANTLVERFLPECARGICIFVGAGNNGGDGWVIAREFLGRGFRVSVVIVAPPVTGDARRAMAEVDLATLQPIVAPGLVVDAILGTGARGTPRPEVNEAIAQIAALRAGGARVASIDVPTGIDATTGQCEVAVGADLTVCLGHWKRGVLARRDRTGALVLIDIGLRRYVDGSDAVHGSTGQTPAVPEALFVDADAVQHMVPRIGALDHKGARRRLLIVGGAEGMAGASVLAARAALRSGIGMIRFCAHPSSHVALQAACPEGVVIPWPTRIEHTTAALSWPHGLLIGPGFGVDRDARERAERWLEAWRGPVVVDADVFTAFAGDTGTLASLLSGRPAVATPHVAEAGRLLGVTTGAVLADPWHVAEQLATQLQATVLLKGVPTLVAAPDRPCLVVARGTPALGTGGSGDVLAGVIATLLAQGVPPQESAAAGAFVHGRAAEIAGVGRPVRGVTLEDVIHSIPEAWRLVPDRLGDHELAVLPQVGED
ncbi:MAG: NAD(P)H-hydrate dehydratase [Gemmatimonadaceae bacterium]|nr:NAD(P)H-hydrate dehydratase [Gemmatimonadaceae bacterium]